MKHIMKKPIEAEQFTDENKDRCFNFVTCNKTAERENNVPILKIQTLKGIITARFGDWVIKEHNNFSVLSDTEFKDLT